MDLAGFTTKNLDRIISMATALSHPICPKGMLTAGHSFPRARISDAFTTHVSWLSALGPNSVASDTSSDSGTSYRRSAKKRPVSSTLHREHQDSVSIQISALAKATITLSGTSAAIHSNTVEYRRRFPTITSVTLPDLGKISGFSFNRTIRSMSGDSIFRRRQVVIS